MRAYIEVASTFVLGRFELHPFDLWAIGDFTRENIVGWLDRGNCLDGWIGTYGYEDFHAVCGDMEIPWADQRHSKDRVGSERPVTE